MAAVIPQLSENAVEGMLNQEAKCPLVVQMVQYKKISDPHTNQTTRYRLHLSDGHESSGTCMLATQRNELIENGTLDNLAVIKVNHYISNQIQSKKFVVLVDFEVLVPGRIVGKVLGEPKNGPKMSMLFQGDPGLSTHLNCKVVFIFAYIYMYICMYISVKTTVSEECEITKSSSSLTASSATKSHNSSTRTASLASKSDNSSIAPQGEQQRIIFPIISLSPYQSKWCIRARVTRKTDIRNWSNKRGDGKLFSVDLMDESGEIRATAFNQECDRLYSVLQPKQVYLIRGGIIKVANRQFTSIDNDYELAFSSETQVEPCKDENVHKLPLLSFRFVKFDEIPRTNRKQLIDILGVVEKIGELEHKVARASQRELLKRDLFLIDDTKTAITLTLWGNEAENFKQHGHPIIAVKGVRISDFGGGVSLSTVGDGQIHVDPDIPEAHKLRGWFEKQDALEIGQNLSTFSGDSSSSSNLYKNLVPVALADPNRKTETVGDNAEYFNVSGSVMYISRENCMYPACPSPDCNKKIADLNTGLYRCEKCNKDFPSFKWRLLLSIRVGDFSGSVMTTLFQDTAEKLLNCDVDRLVNLREQDVDSYDAVFDNVLLKSFIFRLRAKQEIYNDEMRMKYVCMQVYEINKLQYIGYVEEEVKRLASLPSPY
ncbi:Replication protein A 70 kDa DNA-binding subunit [Trichinella britovi]|uniref:Replication protein A subunit n=1 Tax=Trichinella britovi TaxID=45882 RepID=A0A0V1C9X4_TRIBR|nr:Replication protein A 70 kDa DNA-binding subunit [Trichinella britovi]